jgi:predicted AAA+ superfamily ATPase
MISRTLGERLRRVAEQFPVATVTGPRQSGKTTLCQMVFGEKAYVSLEAPDQRAYATSDPRGFLGELSDGAIIDEVQRVQELLSYIQEEVDARPGSGRFILTGSANFALLESISQSLAGRTGLLTLLPCGREEYSKFPNCPDELWETVWLGGFPAIPERRIDPGEWFASYVGTYLERDVRQLVNVANLSAFQTFLELVAGRSGQLLNLSALGSEVGISHNTARAWLSVLEASYVAFRLPPFHANLGKRLTKAPKLYFYDTGLACYLLGIQDSSQLRRHPLRGALFESWIVTEVLKSRLHRGQRGRIYFFRDHAGHEVDLVVPRGESTVLVEVKSAKTVARDFFKNLSWLDGLVGFPAHGAVEKVVLFGGDQEQQRSVATVWPWSKVAEYDWAG